MKVLLDACVLYPTVMREVVLAVAAKGIFQPLWSDRLLEEWARAAARHGAEQETYARGEIVVLRARWTKSIVQTAPGIEARLWLPDKNDEHVLASAIAGSADILLTLNAKDFPKNILAEEGVTRCDPDGFLCDLWVDFPAEVTSAAFDVQKTAEALSGESWQIRKLLKKARLPRLGKMIEAYEKAD